MSGCTTWLQYLHCICSRQGSEPTSAMAMTAMMMRVTMLVPLGRFSECCSAVGCQPPPSSAW